VVQSEKKNDDGIVIAGVKIWCSMVDREEEQSTAADADADAR
jgi:hypothetical protein